MTLSDNTHPQINTISNGKLPKSTQSHMDKTSNKTLIKKNLV